MDSENMDSDSELVRQARSGSEQAFRMIFQRYYDLVHGYAYRICHDAGLADDIAQQTFIKLANALPAYHEKQQFKSWLFRIALNTARDQLRSSRRHQSKIDHFSDSSDKTRPESQLDLINEWLDKLPESIREAFMLVHGWGYTQREAALQLNCPEGTVAWRISEARNIFSELQS